MNTKTCISTRGCRHSWKYCFWCSFGEIKFDLTLKNPNILYMMKANMKKYNFLMTETTVSWLVHSSLIGHFTNGTIGAIGSTSGPIGAIGSTNGTIGAIGCRYCSGFYSRQWYKWQQQQITNVAIERIPNTPTMSIFSFHGCKNRTYGLWSNSIFFCKLHIWWSCQPKHGHNQRKQCKHVCFRPSKLSGIYGK